MKRIYMTLALIGGLAIGANAQVADLESLVDMLDNTCLNNGQTIVPDTAQTPFGAWGILNNGPESLLSGDRVNFIYPESTLGSGGVGVYYVTLSADVPAGDFAYVASNLKVDSINTLLNIDSFNAGVTTFSGLLVPRASLQPNQVYGFYMYTIGTGNDLNNPDNTDTVNNNFVFVPVKWNCNLSVEEMIKGAAKESITTYPNPANNEISFDYIFATPSKTATARITDLTGRTLLVKDFGKSYGYGTQKFTLDVSSLPSGTYLLEFVTDEKRGISKFNKR